ncbi:glycosyltransferase family 4 protein [Flavobacteriaceae bacterium]|jgi:glycosyltransferase involved in cell wall biosynthesis|nr:glycosyltransferase family 4 protein [Flavobacteriaceae bacterium]
MTLLIGSLPPPITGQSISFSYLTNLTNQGRFRIYNTNKTSFNFFNYLDSLLFLPIYILFNQFDSIYFLGSRSKFGFLRQLPFVSIAILKRIKLINHLHGADFKEFYKNSGFLRGIIKWTYKNVDTSIVLLEEMKDQFKAFPKMKLEVVPNAVSKKLENLDIAFPKENRILFLSNIMLCKGIIEFLTASKQLLKDDNSIRIDIAGDFMSDNYLNKNQIKKKFFDLFEDLINNFPGRIFYHGPVSGIKKVDLLKSSSIFILPTYYPTEAYPISIIEAMASGNAIVTTKHNYLEKIISKKNGETIQIKDSNQIVSTIKNLFSDQQKLQIIQRNNLIQSKKHNLDNHLSELYKIIIND